MTDELIKMLNKVEGGSEGTQWYRNPEGPEATVVIERLRARVAELEGGLGRAIGDMASWGAYADEYFQKKFDLAGDLEAARQALKGGA